MRRSGRKFEVWMSADDVTAPVAGDKILYQTTVNPSMDAQQPDATAAGDTGAVPVGGIPKGTVRGTGRANIAAGATDRVLAAVKDQLPRQFRIVWDGDENAIGLDFIALVQNWSQNGNHSGPWDTSFTLNVSGTISEDTTVV